MTRHSMRWFAALALLVVPRAALAETALSRVVVAEQSPYNPWMKTIGDLSGDGLPDLVVSGATGPVVWWRAPDWTMATIADAADSQSGSATADLDGDGDIDVVIGTTWYENPGPPGDGTWNPHSLGSGGTHDVIVLDLDGDGARDVAMRGETDSYVELFVQDSPDSWQHRTLDPGTGLNGLAGGDLDGDGDVDLVVSCAWLENPGDVLGGNWATHPLCSWDPFAAITLHDMNADDRLDVVISASEGPGTISWFENPGDPGAGAWTEHYVVPGTVTNVHAVHVGDFDADGILDVVGSEYAGEGRLLFARGQASGEFVVETIANDYLHNTRVADLGADGDLDIFGARAWDVVEVIVWDNAAGGGASGEDSGGSSGPAGGSEGSTGAADGTGANATDGADLGDAGPGGGSEAGPGPADESTGGGASSGAAASGDDAGCGCGQHGDGRDAAPLLLLTLPRFRRRRLDPTKTSITGPGLMSRSPSNARPGSPGAGAARRLLALLRECDGRTCSCSRRSPATPDTTPPISRV